MELPDLKQLALVNLPARVILELHVPIIKKQQEEVPNVLKLVEKLILENSMATSYDWWKKNIIYQVYPRSFYDSNGDGIGDLQGIKEKLDYFEWLGVRVLWLSPVYKSPMADFGYDISDYRDIDKLFGTLNDFKQLLDDMHNRGMYLIMDLVPNHTSICHKWFQSSVKKVDPYSDYYVWKDGKVNKGTRERMPPNNWTSCFGGSAWSWNEERGQFYLHNFLSEQPDLNYRNHLVQEEMKQIIEFWLNLGVDGFRIDAVPFLVKHESFADNIENKTKYNVDQPETYKIVSDWIKLIRKFGKEHRKYIFVVTEAYTSMKNVIKYYNVGVDFPFNFLLINWSKSLKCDQLKKSVMQWMREMPKDCWSNWVISNHDQSRIATRLGGREYVDVANMLLLLLPGTPTCYYGDELGMEDVEITFEQCRDPFGKKLGYEHFATKTRDPCRSPMVWSTEPNAGFTQSDEPWLPLTNNFRDICVEVQKLNVRSHLNLFKQLLELRQEPAFSSAVKNLKFVNISDDNSILAFVRSSKILPFYLVVLNIGTESDKTKTFDLSENGLYAQAKVVARSTNLADEDYAEETIVNLKSIRLKKAQGLVLQVEKLRKRRFCVLQ